MEAHGGLLSAADLANYRTTPTDPLWGEYRGTRVATNQPPGGGLMLLQMLNILENFDLRSLGHNSPEYLRVLCETMKRATADKDAHISDPAFVDVPVEQPRRQGLRPRARRRHRTARSGPRRAPAVRG